MVRRSESFYFALTVDLLANLYFSPFGSTKKRFTAYQVGTLPLFYPLSLPLPPVLAPFWAMRFSDIQNANQFVKTRQDRLGTDTHEKFERNSERKACVFFCARAARRS